MNGKAFLQAIVTGQVRSVHITPTNTLQITLRNGQRTFLTQTRTSKQFSFETAAKASQFVSFLNVEVVL